MKALLLGVALWGLSYAHAAELNARAPAFTLENSHHEKCRLADFRGTVVVINFWASWCAPCQAELPALSRLASDYARKKVRIIAINVDQDRLTGEKTLERLGLTNTSLNILWDSSSKIVSAYAIDAMPSSFIVDAGGVIRFKHTGFHQKDPQFWHREIDQLLVRTL